MPWTWDEISRDWLGGASIALPPEEVVTAFNTAERVLGTDWVIGHRERGGVIVTGASVTLAVAWVGRALGTVEGRRGSEKLIGHLRRGDRFAFAELQAAALCVIDPANTELQCEAATEDQHHTRLPDLRMRQSGDSDWTYIEVAAPDMSAAEGEARALMQRLSGTIALIPLGTALDLALRRDPTTAEADLLAAEMVRLATAGGSGVHEIPGLASIGHNTSHPADFVLHDDGGPNMPRLGVAQFEARGGERANKRVSIRYPYSDERAEAFLRDEARQLPRNAPGVVMLDVRGAPGGLNAWQPLILRRLQPAIHTRVSAVCLFEGGQESGPSGEGIVMHTVYLENRHARWPAPVWLRNALQRFASAAT